MCAIFGLLAGGLLGTTRGGVPEVKLSSHSSFDLGAATLCGSQLS